MASTKMDIKAFGGFRALDGNGDTAEREQLFRNVARLFSFVCERCDDEQVEQYDDVLCQLAELVEVEARVEVAEMLSKLERAPGTVVVKLANDEIEVAQPLLEFSNVLSDDDLIEIVGAKSEEHRVIIAGRSSVPERVGEAIVTHGGEQSVVRLVKNDNASLNEDTLGRLVEKAAQDSSIAQNLRGRTDVDWSALEGQIKKASKLAVKRLNEAGLKSDKKTIDKASAVVLNRIQNRAGFNASTWRVAWNQVKALGDRKQLDHQSLARFSRFGYGHHFGASIACMLNLKPEMFVKWLAKQDYRAVIVAAKTLGLSSEAFEQGMMILPWRGFPSMEDIAQSRKRFEALNASDAEQIFSLWRRNEARGKNKVEEIDQDFLAV